MECFNLFRRLVHRVNDMGIDAVVSAGDFLLCDLQSGQLHTIKLAREITNALVAIHAYYVNDAPHSLFG